MTPERSRGPMGSSPSSIFTPIIEPQRALSSSSSATASQAPAAASASRVLTPKSQPITIILSNDFARIYRHTHPVLILSIFYLAFNQLVADPVEALIRGLVPLAVAQLVYCVLCLPAFEGKAEGSGTNGSGSGNGSGGGNGSASTGLTSSMSSGSTTTAAAGAGGAGKTPKRKRVQFAKPPPTVWSRIIPAIYSLLLAVALAVPLTTVLLICHGAPLTTHLLHTLLCATHMSLLGALPLFYVHGVDSRMWREVAAAALPFDEVWGGTVGTVVGAWLGAVPIPLDWDREWQKWPVTIVTGAVLGWAVGRLGGEYGIRGKRIDFVEKD